MFVIETHESNFLQQGESERRCKRRFQIEQDIRYKMLYGQRIAETGTGKTLNISSAVFGSPPKTCSLRACRWSCR